MTPISRLLRQKPNLCARAVEQTRDVNEAYLVVHGVMANAFGRVNEADHDLGPDLTRALDHRAQRRERAGSRA